MYIYMYLCLCMCVYNVDGKLIRAYFSCCDVKSRCDVVTN